MTSQEDSLIIISVIDPKLAKDTLWVSSIGWVMAICPAIGGAMGYFLDKWLRTSPLFLIVFIVIGMIAGIYEAIKMITREGKE
ncbi:MAG: AtpZ/AtpI family protein [Candidatus Desantisbacteria bacterium]